MAVDADFGPDSLAAPPDEPDKAPDKNKLFLRLFLQNERRLYAYILTLLPHRADADDVLQETSMTLWDKFDAAAPPTEFLAWARRFAYHKVLDFYKKSQRAEARLSQIFLKRVAETAAGQSEALQLDDRREALTGCMEKLPPRDRDLLTRRFADGATTLSTSAQVGRSVDAVYKALAKLREALLQCIQKTLAREGQT
jgi:RNA polymerase sigma-70 factor, ECF subfamily